MPRSKEELPAELRRRRGFAAFTLVAAVALALLLPIVFVEIMLRGLANLHLSATAALIIILSMFAGALINIPVKRIERAEWQMDDPLAVFGLAGILPVLLRRRKETIVAVNVGGCIIPSGLALYELWHLAALGRDALIPVGVASAINIALCFSLARPVPGVGIVMPVAAPAILAAVSALLVAPANAAPVAFIAGTVGPLIGADIFHLRAIARSFVGTASIGGAGTFDGIVLSGLIAAYLA
jgi:uncharacterized membrane protein